MVEAPIVQNPRALAVLAFERLDWQSLRTYQYRSRAPVVPAVGSRTGAPFANAPIMDCMPAAMPMSALAEICILSRPSCV
jgi:hypothetical protein